MKLAVSAYSYANSKISDIERIHHAAETGFQGIEFVELLESQEITHEEKLAYAKSLRREAEACGLAIPAYAIGATMYHGDREADLCEIERLKREAEVAAALGAPVMRHDIINTEVVNGRVVSFERMLPVIADNVRAVTEYAETLGVRTCSENHGRLIQDIDRMEKLYNTVGHDNYGLLLDMGNFACADVSSTAAFSRLAPYAVHVHIKDMKIIRFGEEYDPNVYYITSRSANKLELCTLGEGDIPAAHCIAILKRAKPVYDGWISLEYEGKKPSLEEIPKSFALMKQYVGE